MGRVTDWLRALPGMVPLGRRVRGALWPAPRPFAGSAAYWRGRYAGGGDSGAGSQGKFASFKAEVLNAHFRASGTRSVVEFGCGDGRQLALLEIPQYLGVDISADAVARCRARFAGIPGRRFVLAEEYDGESADCALSLDVIFHLVEDTAFEAYMRRLFAAARREVVIYSSNHDDPAPGEGPHVRHRRFEGWIDAQAPGWRLVRRVPNAYPFRGDYRSGSFADFHFYERAP